MIAAFVVALIAAGLLGLPADWVRRRKPGPAAMLAGLGNATGLVVAVGAVAAAGLVSGAGVLATLVLGLVAGNVAADAIATRVWGPPGKSA